MNRAKVCLLVLLAGTARAQMPTVRQLSVRWAEYYAAIYQVPVELVEAIIDEESGWNPYAVSSKGAVGIMQLMPETAVRFGVQNRFRVNENIRGGVAYLAHVGGFVFGALTGRLFERSSRMFGEPSAD